MASGRQSDIGANTSRSLEAGRIVDRSLEAECGDWTDTWHGHEPSDLRFRTLRSRSSVCCSIALRALSSGPTTAINSGRSANSSSARTAKTQTDILEQAADRILRRPRPTDRAGAGNGFWFSPPGLLAPVFFRWRRRILALHPIARVIDLGAHE